jgi:GR25 family glycosyltransferase involved in LPS biosynthesis
MDNLSNCQFYCLSYYTEKTNKMKQLFNDLNINCIFSNGVKHQDKRIDGKRYNKEKRKQLSIMHGHLEIIEDFYNNNNSKYAIICEDDIMIHYDIKSILRKVIIDFNILGLDILLLGYMLPYKITFKDTYTRFPLKRQMPENSIYKYHNYPDYISGTQMYIITKPHAKYILKKYHSYDNNILDKPYSIDKLLIHCGNRALLYPMLAIENNEQEDPYHKLCRKIHYDDCFM